MNCQLIGISNVVCRISRLHISHTRILFWSLNLKPYNVFGNHSFWFLHQNTLNQIKRFNAINQFNYNSTSTAGPLAFLLIFLFILHQNNIFWNTIPWLNRKSPLTLWHMSFFINVFFHKEIFCLIQWLYFLYSVFVYSSFSSWEKSEIYVGINKFTFFVGWSCLVVS